MKYVLINTYVTQKPNETITCLESSSLQRAYKVINFLANRRAPINPSATNTISEITSMSDKRCTESKEEHNHHNPNTQISV